VSLPLLDPITSDATFSPCRKYRYTLTRTWVPDLPLINFVMLNPSTADEVVNDPTVERCERRARMWNCGGLIVTNIFAWRSTDPDELRRVADPVGPDKDDALVESAWRNWSFAPGATTARSSAAERPSGSDCTYLRPCITSGCPRRPASPDTRYTFRTA
jgi:hypothetical protein